MEGINSERRRFAQNGMSNARPRGPHENCQQKTCVKVRSHYRESLNSFRIWSPTSTEYPTFSRLPRKSGVLIFRLGSRVNTPNGLPCLVTVTLSPGLRASAVLLNWCWNSLAVSFFMLDKMSNNPPPVNPALQRATRPERLCRPP